MERQQCKATNRQGKQCSSKAIQGATVCRLHGGAAPQVQQAARARLALLVDPALSTLHNLVTKSKVDAVKMQAVKDILDRNGFKPKDEINVTGEVSLIDRLAAGRKRAQEAE